MVATTLDQRMANKFYNKIIYKRVVKFKVTIIPIHNTISSRVDTIDPNPYFKYPIFQAIFSIIKMILKFIFYLQNVKIPGKQPIYLAMIQTTTGANKSFELPLAAYLKPEMSTIGTSPD